MDEPIEFPYNRSIIKLLLYAIATGILCYAQVDIALTNNQGMIFRGFHLNAQEATRLYLFGAVLLGAVAVVCVITIICTLINRGALRLTKTTIEIPMGLLMNIYEIPFNEIFNVKRNEINGAEFLEFLYKNKKMFIYQDYLPSNEIFEQVCNIVNKQAGSRTFEFNKRPPNVLE